MARVENQKNKYVTIPQPKRKTSPRILFKRGLFSLFITVTIATVLYISTPISRLGVIYFDGISAITRSELLSLMKIEEDVFFLSINLDELETSILTHPVVSQVRVTRDGINSLNVNILEYEVGACTIIANELFHILTDGKVVHESMGMRSDCVGKMIHGLTTDEVEAGIVGLFVRQLMRVNEDVRNMITRIEHEPLYGDLYRFSIDLVDGNTVKVTTHTLHETFNYYNLLIERFIIEGHLEQGQTGVLHLDVGNVFIPND